MDSSQDSPTLTPRPTGKKRSAVWWLVGAVLSLLLFGLIVLFVTPTRTEPSLVWLTPAQAQQMTNPGLLTRLTQSAKTWLTGLRRRFFRGPPAGRILLQFQIFSVSPEANLPALLGAPASTNADGRRAWMLSASDYTSKKQDPDFRHKHGLTGLFSPGVLTTDGQQARMNMGTSIPSGPPSSLTTGPKGPYRAPTIFTGTAIDVVPQSIPGVERLIRLQVTASSTEIGTVSATNVILKTNFFTASQALVNSGGALVIECPNSDAANPTNYLMIVAPGYQYPNTLR